MVMDIAEKPRETFILHRGDYSQPTEKVTAGTPAVLPPLPAGAPANRLGLAQWITMREHPLTARVAVNRLWQIFFGTGIVATAADFGAQGEYPSHPELLDWLAVDFMDNGWDVKRTGPQNRHVGHVPAISRQPPAQPERPRPRSPAIPQNRLLARGPRFRLPAEFIRDAALKVSGLLVDRLGGPSVNPYTPGDLWREISHYGSTPATAQTFVQDHGEKLYRRSLYTYWKRTVPPPNMVAFDAPNREICIVARPIDHHAAASARAAQRRAIRRSRAGLRRADRSNNRATTPTRLRWAFEECVSRPPIDAEFAVLTDALDRERTRYAANESAAQRIPRQRRIAARRTDPRRRTRRLVASRRAAVEPERNRNTKLNRSGCA